MLAKSRGDCVQVDFVGLLSMSELYGIATT